MYLWIVYMHVDVCMDMDILMDIYIYKYICVCMCGVFLNVLMDSVDVCGCMYWPTIYNCNL